MKMFKFIFLLFALFCTSCCLGQRTADWYEHASFYQIYPRSFKDSNGDGIGDLKGMIANLDHLKDAGITAFWLSPIFASPQIDLGYDVSDFYKIEPDYGTMEDFDNLLKKAKNLGLKVLLDFIPNHTSNKHQWFIESENKNPDYIDYYVWHNGNPNPAGGLPLVPNNWVSVFGGPAWTWSEKRQQYYLHQFTFGQPDLNYRNSKVIDEMTNVLKFYADKGVDGFRLDAINHMYEDAELKDEPVNQGNNDPNSYDHLQHIYTKDLDETYEIVYKWREFLDQMKTNSTVILMTEAYASTRDTMRYFVSDDGKKLGSHMPFNFQLIYAFEPNTNALRVKRGIDEWMDNMPAGFFPHWVVGSHDHSRVGSRVDPDIINVANAMVLTLPGVSITYYGEEIGMVDNKRFEIIVDNRDPNRTPMQWDDTNQAGFTTGKNTWLPVNINYRKINLSREKNLQKGVYKFFQSLTKLRTEETFRYGGINLKVINSDVLAFTRELNGEPSYLIAVNFGNRERKVDLTVFKTLSENLKVVAASPVAVYENGDVVDISNIALARFDAVVLSSVFKQN